MSKRVLIVTPRSPFLGRGADEQDRLSGIEWFVEHGYGVEVITKIMPSDMAGIEAARIKYGITIEAVSYKQTGRKSFTTVLRRLLNPLFWDGAAYEYFDSEIQRKVRDAVMMRKPDFVWFDYTYLWPLYHIAKDAGIPIVTRSINFEPEHFLDEDGHTFINKIRALPKYWSEKKVLRRSNWFFAITPKEEKIYKTLGTTPVRVLPLRALPSRLIKRKIIPHKGIRIGFMPSTYTVDHNKEALRFLVEEVWPLLPDDVRNTATLHITGNKFPESFKSKMPKGIIYEGFVPSSVAFWQGMDIALAPSLFGAGMQQKIFEPIALGVPTITSKRGLAGYPFECGKHLVCAETKDKVAEALTTLMGQATKRQEISNRAQELSKKLFSPEVFNKLLQEAIISITSS